MANIGSALACTLSCDGVVSRLRTDVKEGLSRAEVHKRQALYGPNEFAVDEKESLISKFAEQFKDPLIMLLLGSAVVSVLLGQYDDAFSITLVRGATHRRGRGGPARVVGAATDPEFTSPARPS